MNFSQMKDERLLLFYENVRQQVALDGKSRLLARASKHTLTSFATKWTDGSFDSRRLIGQRTALHDENQNRGARTSTRTRRNRN